VVGRGQRRPRVQEMDGRSGFRRLEPGPEQLGGADGGEEPRVHGGGPGAGGEHAKHHDRHGDQHGKGVALAAGLRGERLLVLGRHGDLGQQRDARLQPGRRVRRRGNRGSAGQHAADRLPAAAEPVQPGRVRMGHVAGSVGLRSVDAGVRRERADERNAKVACRCRRRESAQLHSERDLRGRVRGWRLDECGDDGDAVAAAAEWRADGDVSGGALRGDRGRADERADRLLRGGDGWAGQCAEVADPARVRRHGRRGWWRRRRDHFAGPGAGGAECDHHVQPGGSAAGECAASLPALRLQRLEPDHFARSGDDLERVRLRVGDHGAGAVERDAARHGVQQRGGHVGQQRRGRLALCCRGRGAAG